MTNITMNGIPMKEDKHDNRIIIFDTTLRDGEQSPGFSMTIEEKLQMAHQLAKLKVDVIEAGFPIASEGDFEAVQRIAKEVEGPVICGLARASEKDIDRAWEALRVGKRGRIHTFLATSDIHIEKKFGKTRDEILKMAVRAVEHAVSCVSEKDSNAGETGEVEFSAEDAFRSDRRFLADVVQACIEAGATTINIPDTVGYAITSEFADLIAYLQSEVPSVSSAVMSVHCHNDLGLAVSNSLAAVQQGARQIECTINGIGERAGNAALEEVVMAMNTRRYLFNLSCNIRTEEIYPASRKLIAITGVNVQPNKAIVGDNAFAHEAGIHQDGFLKDPSTYEIMTPQSIGQKKSTLVLGKHSGRHAFIDRLEHLGFHGLSEEEVNRGFYRFKALADKKKTVYDQDIHAIMSEEQCDVEEVFTLEALQTSSGSGGICPTATVLIRNNRTGEVHQDAAIGDGPVDAACKAIDRITSVPGELTAYQIRSVTVGKDALGEASLRVQFGGREVKGKASSTDVVEASAKAYINAVNLFLAEGESSACRDEPSPV